MKGCVPLPKARKALLTKSLGTAFCGLRLKGGRAWADIGGRAPRGVLDLKGERKRTNPQILDLPSILAAE